MSLRTLQREVVRKKMRDQGFTQINKKDKDGRSKFAKHWREYTHK